MPINMVVPTDYLKALYSNDYPDKTIGQLKRADYPNRPFVFDELAKDIAANGVVKPLRVVNRFLVDGHHRAIIALELGLDNVPVEYSGRLPSILG